MTEAPLDYTVVEVVGRPCHVVWTPEDGVIRAAGFATISDPEAQSLRARLAALDPGLASRGLASSARETGVIPDVIRAYVSGNVTAIDELRVEQPGTAFRCDVWRALRNVPAGSTVTYTELASLVGRPAAIRAAASGCASNLVALIVPCHRIVRTDGGLGGYLFGADIKEALLRMEHTIASGSNATNSSFTPS